MAKLMIGDKKVTPAIVINGGGTPIYNQDKTITENGIYTSDEGYTGLGTVTVDVAGIEPTGTIDISQNGSYDVSQYASANVNVEGGAGTIFGADPYMFLGKLEGTTVVLPEGYINMDLGVATDINPLVYRQRFIGKHIQSFVGNNITTLGLNSLERAFSTGYVESFSMPNLRTINEQAMSYVFESANVLSIDCFSNVETIDTSGCFGMFAYSALGVSEIHFDNLVTIGNNGLMNAFSAVTMHEGRTLDIYFPKLQQFGDEAFAGITNYSDATIRLHFPGSLRSEVERQAGYPNFGGNNTSVLFDQGGYICNFSATRAGNPVSLNQLYFNGEAIAETMSGMVYEGSSNEYIGVIQDSSSVYACIGNVDFIPGNTEPVSKVIVYSGYVHNHNITVTNVSDCTFTFIKDGVEYWTVSGGNSAVMKLESRGTTGGVTCRISAPGYVSQTITLTESTSDYYDITLVESQDVTLLDTTFPFTQAIQDGWFDNLADNTQSGYAWLISDGAEALVSDCKVDSGMAYGFIHLTNLDANKMTRVRIEARVSSELNFDWMSVVIMPEDPTNYGYGANEWCQASYRGVQGVTEVCHASGEGGVYAAYEATQPTGYSDLYIAFVYSKDSSSQAGDDTAYIRSIKIEQVEEVE